MSYKQHGWRHDPLKGTDPLCANIIDSTDNIGDCWGVHSDGETSGYVLTADGSGGSVWQAVTGGVPTITPAIGLYNTSVATVSAGGNATLSWTFASGTALLNLTAPTAPTTKTRGIYAVMFNMVCTGGVLNNGRQITGFLSMGSGDVVSAYCVMTGAATTSAENVTATGVRHMLVGSPISFQVNNHDSSSRNIQGQNIAVVKLVDY